MPIYIFFSPFFPLPVAGAGAGAGAGVPLLFAELYSYEGARCGGEAYFYFFFA